MKYHITIAAIALVALASTTSAQQMSYQGRLTNNTGAPQPGPLATLTFSIWDHPTSTNLANKIWGDFALNADLIDGRFSVKLGPNDSASRPLSGAFNGSRYIEIQVASDPPLPRQEILASPQAIRALTADTVPDGAIGTNQLADGSVTAAKLNGATGVWLSSGSNIFHDAGNVGIGNTNPTGYKLDVTGSIRATGSLTGSLDGSNINAASVDLTKLVAAVKDALCPVGTILPYAGDAAPPGWHLCDGTAYYNTSYPALAALIGQRFGNYGYTDGTVFQMPDFRGRFLRGRDGGVARDPDRGSRITMNTGGATGDAVGSVQGHALEFHTHSYTRPQISAQADDGGSAYREVNPSEISGTTGNHNGSNSTETRPINAYVNYIIKY